MSSISDGSTDPLVARFKLLEETVDKLHRENRALKNKLQSYNTLSTFYHEARQQMRTLNMQLAAKENVIQRLKANQGHSGTEEREMGPSKSLVDSLMDQLSSMKNQLKETERACEEKVESLSQEIQRLHQQLEEKDRQMQQYNSWPQHEKEMEICRLQRTLAEKERVQATSEVLCRSLSDESHQLRRKLAATAEMCQHLVKCLEKTQNKDMMVEEPLRMERPSKIQNLDCDNESSLCKLQEENRLLKQKVAHVEDLNAKWQKYDASREEYVKGLHHQLKEMKARGEHHKGVHTAHSASELLQKEIVRLNKLLEDKMNEGTKLKQAAEELENARIADGERIQMLEQQLLVYKDDFTSERSDRERAQSRIQELMEEISFLQHQSRKQDERELGHFTFHTGNKNKKYLKKNVTEPLRGSSSSEHVEGRRQQADRADDHRKSSPERRGQDELQCPHCLRFFQDQLGENFLEHITECCQ
ncbi:TNFAIP3-interacting protein 2 [Rhinophrynus dorsalis]